MVIYSAPGETRISDAGSWWISGKGPDRVSRVTYRLLSGLTVSIHFARVMLLRSISRQVML